jgi:benzoate membrane transport protein
MRSYFSIANITAGFIAVMVGFSSSAAIVFQAASTAGASASEISSWLFALGFSIAIPCIGLSLYYRMPILIGWSTPSAALLVTSLAGVSLQEAIGVFIFSAILTILAGMTGLFEKAISHIPRGITSGMLAGILLHFGLNVFVAMENQFQLVATMLFTYVIGKRFFPRYVILIVFMIGILVTKITGSLDFGDLHFALSFPIWTTPVFNPASLISIGIPLFIVTMTSQNIPGITILHESNFRPPISPVISWIGCSSLLFAPFGCYSICLTALTAAICTSNEAGSDPTARYKSTIFAGICWFAIGIFGSTIVALFSAFPKALVISIAGLALFSSIGSSLKIALDEASQREPAIITLLISASGISIFGVGGAFWGLLAGIVCSIVLNWRPLVEIRAKGVTVR